MVLTTTEAVQSCNRITLDRDIEATWCTSDADLGRGPAETGQALVACWPIAELQTAPARIGAEIAVSGYSYEDSLSSPTLTFGSFDEDKGLNGEADLARLTLNALPGDAGGPVLDSSGAVLGMLLPRGTDGTPPIARRGELCRRCHGACRDAAKGRACSRKRQPVKAPWHPKTCRTLPWE